MSALEYTSVQEQHFHTRWKFLFFVALCVSFICVSLAFEKTCYENWFLCGQFNGIDL